MANNSTAAPLVDPASLPWVEYRHRRLLPDMPGIYFVFERDGSTCYIGRSNSIRRRWLNHHRRQQFKKMGATRIGWLAVTEERLLPEIESALIQHFRPKLNGGPVVGNKPLLNFVIDPELLERIDTFRFQHRFESRAAAIKFLLSWALDQKPTP